MKNLRFLWISLAVGGIIILIVLGRQFGVHTLADIALKKEIVLPSESGKTPTFEIKDFRLVQTVGKNKQWELKALEAYEYEEGDEIEIHGTEIKFFKKDNVLALTLKADQGVVDSKNRDIGMTGSIEAETPDGLKLKTQTLRWLAKDEKLVTDDRVTVTKGEVRIDGQGFEADACMGKLQVKKKVRVKIARDVR